MIFRICICDLFKFFTINFQHFVPNDFIIMYNSQQLKYKKLLENLKNLKVLEIF